MFEQFLQQTRDIRLSEAHHGPAGNRALDFETSFLMRGLTQLHLELDPA